MTILEAITENKDIVSGLLAGGGSFLVGWVVWSIKRWLDGRYERRRLDTEEARKQRIEAIAREVLSCNILHEFTRSTTTTALNSPEHTASVESVITNSIPVQRVIDARVVHGWNNHQYDLDKMIRERLNESNAPILDAIKELGREITAIQIACAGSSHK